MYFRNISNKISKNCIQNIKLYTISLENRRIVPYNIHCKRFQKQNKEIIIMKKLLSLLAVSTLVLTLTACQDASTSSEDVGANYPEANLDFVAPGGAGGGWDTTIRAVAQTLGETGLVEVAMPVRNNPGAGGSVHLAELQTKVGDENIITVYSSPLLLTNLSGTTTFNHKNVTPIANLIADYAVFVVPANSEFNTMDEVLSALQADVKSVKIGGASAAGSMDHLQFLKFAKKFGITELKEIPYVAFDEGAEAQLLGGHIDLLSTGLSEVTGLLDSGDLKALCQTSDKDELLGVPSCISQGIDETFVNWRGLFGAPDMPDYALEYWKNTLREMIGTDEWAAQREKYGWDSYYMDHGEYKEFLDQAYEDYDALLQDLGMR
jgi:putative tricarboxylic transport membrane protein